MKKFICRNCGVVNVISDEALASQAKDWLDCTLPDGFEWILPAGKITPVYGDPIYISGYGEHLSREAYLLKYNIDPEIAYRLMRARIGMKSASRMMSDQTKEKAQIGSYLKSHPLLDDDDWTA